MDINIFFEPDSNEINKENLRPMEVNLSEVFEAMRPFPSKFTKEGFQTDIHRFCYNYYGKRYFIHKIEEKSVTKMLKKFMSPTFNLIEKDLYHYGSTQYYQFTEKAKMVDELLKQDV